MDKQISHQKIYTVDEALIAVGPFGFFQKIVEAIVCFVVLVAMFQPYIMYFSIQHSPWKCVNNSTICLKQGILPSEDFSRCHMPRDQWYFTEHDSFSLVTWFDIPCEQYWVLGGTGTMYFVGVALGSVLLGRIADMKGRKPVLVSSTAMLLLFGLLTAFAPNIYWVLGFRFVVGFFHPGIIVTVAVLMMEIVGPERRNIALLGPHVVIPISFSLVPVKAYLLKNWRMLCIVSTAPYFIVVFVIYWFVPESVKWLYEMGHSNEAVDLLIRIAKYNKNVVPENFILASASKNVKGVSPSGSKVGPNIIVSTLIQVSLWSATNALFYGMMFVVHKLPGNLYLNSFLLNIFEFPTTFIAIASCGRYGRKITNVLPLSLAGVSCIIIAIIPSTTGSIAKVIVAVVGKFLVIITYESMYLWSSELYHTSVRSTALGILELVSRLSTGGVLLLAASTTSSWLTFTLLGTSGLVAACFGMLLPETNPKVVVERDMDFCTRGDPESNLDKLKMSYNYLSRFRIRQITPQTYGW